MTRKQIEELCELAEQLVSTVSDECYAQRSANWLQQTSTVAVALRQLLAAAEDAERMREAAIKALKLCCLLEECGAEWKIKLPVSPKEIGDELQAAIESLTINALLRSMTGETAEDQAKRLGNTAVKYFREVCELRKDLATANRTIKAMGESADAERQRLVAEVERLTTKLEIATKLYARALHVAIDEADDNINDAYLNRMEDANARPSQ